MAHEYYIKIENDEVVGNPVGALNIAALLLNDSFTDGDAATLGYYPIEEAKPELAYNQQARYAGWSKKEDGTFSMDWTVDTISAEDLLTLWIRGRRGFELAHSDWTQVSDAPLTAAQKADWAAYRQALRDLPSTFAGVTSENDIVWPNRPGAPAFVEPV